MKRTENSIIQRSLGEQSDFEKINDQGEKIQWRHVVKSSTEMGALRFVSVGLAATGGMWAARCLGPENLGISTMISATVAQAAIVMNSFPDSLLVRRYKGITSKEERNSLYVTVTSFRLLVAVFCGLVASVAICSNLLPPNFKAAGFLGVILLVAKALTPTWIYQANEDLRLYIRIELFVPILIILGYGMVMRPGAGAGTDLLIQAVASCITVAIMLSRLHTINDIKTSVYARFAVRTVADLLWSGRWLALMHGAIYCYVGFDIALIGYLRGVETAGIYRTAQAWPQAISVILALPTLVLFPKFVVWRKISPMLLWRRQQEIGSLATTVAVIGCVVVYFALPPLHRFWFGDGYEGAALPAVILVCSKLIVLISGVFGWGIIAGGQNDHRMALLMCTVAGLSITANFLVIPPFGMLGSALVNLACEVLILVVVVYLSKVQSSPKALKTE